MSLRLIFNNSIYNILVFMEQVIFDVKLSRNFYLSEFIRSETAQVYGFNQQFELPVDALINILSLVTNVLQPLRCDVGKIIINSGYRCKELNKKIGGVSGSQHLTGMAADIVCDDIRSAACFIIQRNFDQLIVYKNFLHVSFNHDHNRKQLIFKTM